MVVVALGDPSTPVTCGVKVSGFPAFLARAGPAHMMLAAARTPPTTTQARALLRWTDFGDFMKTSLLLD